LGAPLTSVVLALAIAQATGAPPRPDREPVTPPAESVEATAAPRSFSGGEEEPPPQGLPFMPTVGPPQRTTDGLFLDLALLSELRARTLSTTDTSPTWGAEVEVTPGVGLEVRSTRFNLAVGYAPRLTVPFNVGSFELAVLNRATVDGSWQVDPHWTLTAVGLFVVGDYSQLIPASTPGGAGPPPPVLNPVRSFQTYPYVGIDTLLRVDGALSGRSRIRLAGGYFDVGGIGDVGQLNQPRTWGPQAEAAFAWDASRLATLITTASARNWWMSGNEYFLIATLTESWKQSWSRGLDTTVMAGVGASNRQVESRTAANHVIPVAELTLQYRTESTQALRLNLDAALSPYFDVYERVPYQRFTFGGSIDWSPSDAWRLGASISAALAPYTVRAPESYGTAGLSANYAPVPFLVLSAGGFSQVQFQGGTAGGGAFRQWTTYFSLTFRDQIPL
jgi:hypothetical protein